MAQGGIEAVVEALKKEQEGMPPVGQLKWDIPIKKPAEDRDLFVGSVGKEQEAQ